MLGATGGLKPKRASTLEAVGGEWPGVMGAAGVLPAGTGGFRWARWLQGLTWSGVGQEGRGRAAGAGDDGWHPRPLLKF